MLQLLLLLSVQVLSLARDPNRFDPKAEYYQLPDGGVDADGKIDTSKREALLTARYTEEGAIRTEQDLWEEQQVNMATRKVGAQVRTTKYHTSN
jgi:hypothetical protein